MEGQNPRERVVKEPKRFCDPCRGSVGPDLEVGTIPIPVNVSDFFKDSAQEVWGVTLRGRGRVTRDHVDRKETGVRPVLREVSTTPVS